MRVAIILAPLLVITAPSVAQDAGAPAPGKFTHADQIAAYASAVVGVAHAEKTCPGYRRSPATMTALRAWMDIRVGDKSELARQTAEVEQKMSAQIATLGAASWCTSILGLFGPEGTLARGLLEAR